MSTQATGNDILTQPTETLTSMADELASQIAEIKAQVHAANLDIKNKKSVDSDWLKKAYYALKRKGATHQKILKEISRRKKESKSQAAENKETTAAKAMLKVAKETAKARRSESIAQHFVDVAKNRLPRNLFDEILAESIDKAVGDKP